VAIILAFVPSVWHVGPTEIGLLIVMAAVQFALPYVLFTRGIAHVPGAEASLIALIEPVLNPVWVALLYGENPSTATIIGGAVILGGLAVRYAVFREPAGAVEGGLADLASEPAVADSRD
jgi:drug/metabolite transporter (DMT)-like permease